MIDKKITWALIFAIVVESASVFAWAGGIGERLKDVEMRGSAQGRWQCVSRESKCSCS